jgi:phenylpropionate dioxygenase-like ring-hydroxylating dioxygenase large terminal subunit
MSAARAILLEVGGLGMIREILFKQNYIQDPRRATILVDELNGAIWVWIGNDVNAQTRKAVLQVAEKIRGEGYQAKADGISLGQSCSQVVVLDQKNLSEPGVQENHQTALNVFNIPMEEEGRFVVRFNASATAATTATGAAPAQGGAKDYALAGVLIASILTTNAEIMISRSSLGVYTIELAEGVLKFQVTGGNIQLMSGSIGISDAIQQAFQENIEFLK